MNKYKDTLKFLENDLTIKNMEIQKLISQINSGSEHEITSIKPGEKIFHNLLNMKLILR